MKSLIENAIRQRTTEEIEVPCDVLQEMFATHTVVDDAQNSYPLDSNISTANANALYRTVMKYKPQLVVEVGMAYGISSLAILTALSDVNENGKLMSIDPGQTSHFHGVGLNNVQRAGFADNHALVEKYDYLALPELVQKETTIDFAYIDGWHTFDYVLLDFFFLDKMLDVNGVVAFNDCAMPAIHKVMGYVMTHRKYEEMDVGLKADYLSRSPVETLRRTILRISKTDRYFQKIENWEPDWNYWKSF
ncbi:MAG: class I SAM-dependent methyltransferase [Chloroflexi bacterium]|nr:class I SAM-dependent methyltransferase [Chloroflexota bacterium]